MLSRRVSPPPHPTPPLPPHPSLSQKLPCKGSRGSLGTRWMAGVYVGPPRPRVSVINHRPRQPATGFMSREMGSFIKVLEGGGGIRWARERMSNRRQRSSSGVFFLFFFTPLSYHVQPYEAEAGRVIKKCQHPKPILYKRPPPAPPPQPKSIIVQIQPVFYLLCANTSSNW